MSADGNFHTVIWCRRNPTGLAGPWELDKKDRCPRPGARRPAVLSTASGIGKREFLEQEHGAML